jgi:hypothetical protein
MDREADREEQMVKIRAACQALNVQTVEMGDMPVEEADNNNNNNGN